MKQFDKLYFAQDLVEQKERLGLSTRKLAKVIKISAPTLSRILNGKTIPDLNTYWLCCDFLMQSTDEYFTKL